MRKVRWGRIALVAAGVLVLAPLALAYLVLRASLPQLEGVIEEPGLKAPVSIERDALGIVTVTAASRADLAFATGFAHAQDRFFQMDLQRRLPAGELAELFGTLAADQDRKARIFRFRALARAVAAQATPEQRALVGAYTRGVNAGLARLGSRPWEYWLLRAAPRPWREEDTTLVAYSMWWDLQYGDFRTARMRRTLDASLGGATCASGWKCALEFLYPAHTQWDSPNVNDEAALAAGDARDGVLGPVPGADALDLRHPRSQSITAGAAVPRGHQAATGMVSVQEALAQLLWRASAIEPRESADTAIGSNSFAVAGRLTASGAALVASDMHLGLRVPSTWYRMRLRLEGADALDLNGVTLPGTPLLVAGSNGRVAWAFTNSYGQWLDLEPLSCTRISDTRLETPQGAVPLTTIIETIGVRGGSAVRLPVSSVAAASPATPPSSGVIGPGAVLFEVEPRENRCWLARWLAQLPAAANLNLQRVEHAASAQEVLELAPQLGIPHQNMVVGDAAGHIGWTIAGRIPVDAGAARLSAPSGWRGSDTQPRIYDPLIGRLWTANARATDDEASLDAIGGGVASLGAGYDLGARARQIRDGLLALHGAVQPLDMLHVQLDDRALFLARWRQLLMELLDAPALQGAPARAQFRGLIDAWDARAAVDSNGYYLVREFHARVTHDLWQMVLHSLGIESAASPPMQFEEPLWRMVSRQPMHLLGPQYASWRAFLLTELDATVGELQRRCGELARCRWGAHNPVRVRHPLSAAVPVLASFLDMPTLELPGDHDMPRVQDGAVGASERFSVSPGHEAQGYLHLPGGQSGHPLSPYYRAGFLAWARGEPLPLLPGPAQHRLEVRPAPGQPVH